MWKDFFSFSRKEQNGIIVLLIIVVLLIVLRIILPKLFSSSGEIVSELGEQYFIITPTQEVKDFKAVAQKKEIPIFDPNKVTPEFLISIGIKKRVADNWFNYLQKGGFFNSPEDVSKIYGMDSNLMAALIPYMIVTEKPTPKNIFEKPEIIAKMYVDSLLLTEKQPIQRFISKAKDFIIEINSADTSELMLLKGIGPVLSRRIVYYRKQLGGFVLPTQLLEIEGILPKVLEDNAENITINTDLIIPLNVNKASIRQLRDHPYLDFYKAKAIVDERKKNLLIEIDDVFDLEPFADIDKEIIKYYLIVK
ncbi:MAG: helix-hairpin-helix domain-containing protein [Marinilabiliaceae bacterium]|nr:helix-hairpin-helix domain-containing protein [Marinilabiliaceae bacterium]